MTTPEDSPEEELRQLNASLNRASRREYWLAWKCLIADRCSSETNWTLSRLDRWFYTFKAMVCLALNRKGRSSTWNGDPGVQVAIMRSERDGYGWSATWLSVGYGRTSGWRYQIHSDSEWY